MAVPILGPVLSAVFAAVASSRGVGPDRAVVLGLAQAGEDGGGPAPGWTIDVADHAFAMLTGGDAVGIVDVHFDERSILGWASPGAARRAPHSWDREGRCWRISFRAPYRGKSVADFFLGVLELLDQYRDSLAVGHGHHGLQILEERLEARWDEMSGYFDRAQSADDWADNELEYTRQEPWSENVRRLVDLLESGLAVLDDDYGDLVVGTDGAKEDAFVRVVREILMGNWPAGVDVLHDRVSGEVTEARWLLEQPAYPITVRIFMAEGREEKDREAVDTLLEILGGLAEELDEPEGGDPDYEARDLILWTRTRDQALGGQD